MNIFLVNGVYPPGYLGGGTSYTSYQLAEALQELDVDVNVLTTDVCSKGKTQPRINERIVINGSKVIFFHVPLKWGFLKYFSLNMIVHVFKNIKKMDFVILNSCFNLYGILIGWICAITRVPYFVYPHGSLDEYVFKGFLKTFWWNALEKKIYFRAKGVVCLTENEKKQLQKIKANKNLFVIPNGVNINFPKREKKENKIKRFLFLGRVVPKKGVDHLIKAFNYVLDNQSNVELVIAGPCEKKYQEYLISLLKSEYLSKVVFLGPVYSKEKIDLIYNSDAFLLPSHSEGLPMSVLEAMALKTPVIISAFCNIPEIEKYSAGIIHRSMNPVEIAKDYLRFLNLDKSDLDQMTSNSYELVDQYFKWNQVAKKTLQAMKEYV